MERDTFETAASRYSRRIFTYASYLLGDRGEAEDVTQEVLIKLWTSGDAIGGERLGAWLVRVTRNACIDALRHRKRLARIVPIHRPEADATDSPSPAPSPERMAVGSELGQRILDALCALAEPARSAVILREVLGLSYREIGEVLDIPVATLKVTLHRARRRLRESLKEVRSDVAAG